MPQIMDSLVKPIIGILTGRIDMLSELLDALAESFGKTDIIGEWQAFNHTNYYEDEMGCELSRCFVSFERLVPPDTAGKFKGWTKEIEGCFVHNGRRTVNIDPGYLDANKVVLITGKHGGHRIALSSGVWADILLWYNKGWTPLPWAFPDFCDGRFFEVFSAMRARYKSQLREARENITSQSSSPAAS